jgi:hypothetical protein
MLRCVAFACLFMICVKVKHFVYVKASPRTLGTRWGGGIYVRAFGYLWMYVCQQVGGTYGQG